MARRAGSKNRIIIVAQKVPREMDWQILPAMAEVKLPTIAVTKMRIEAEVRMALIDLL